MASGKPPRDRGRHGRAQAPALSEDGAAGPGAAAGASEEEVRKILSPAKRSKGYDVDGRRRVEERTWVY